MSKSKARSKVLQGLRARMAVAPLGESSTELGAWFKTPLGRALLSAQKKILAKELHNLFGYHLAQLSVIPETRLYAASRISHCFSLAPAEGATRKKVSGVGDFQTLPLPDESIDVCVLHHALDFSENPQQVLKEAARVTIPKGYIVLLGFNPWSLRGLLKFPMQLFSQRAVWHHHNLRMGRIKDWLSFLDFSCAKAKYSYFNLPINSKKYLRNTHFSPRWAWTHKIPIGASYCLVARKDKVAMTPIKPAWDTHLPITQRAVVSKRAVSAGANNNASVNEPASILPLRRRKIINKHE